MMTENKSFTVYPFLIMFIAIVVLISIRRYDSGYYGFTYPDSYKTGIPSPKEVTYGTTKTFTEHPGAWAEETWEWPQSIKNENTMPHYSACGHVRWFNPEHDPEDKDKPYQATAYHNFSDEHYFSALKEADEFVERWCKP